MEGSNFITRITEENICIQKAFEFVQDKAHGAISNFIGIIRNKNLGREVVGVSYDVFTPLAETTFLDLCNDANAQWGRQLKIFIEHFKGRLNVGEISLVIAVSSPHRDEAFKACRFIIEGIKHHSPIWKQEYYADGNTEWMKGHALCRHT